MEITVELVEEALDQLWNYSRMGAHPLAAVLLKPARANQRPGLMERGAELNQHLIDAIEQVKISHANPGRSRERRYYAILSGCFVERRTNREVARTLNVSERTFYRERLRALAVLTRVLADGVGHTPG